MWLINCLQCGKWRNQKKKPLIRSILDSGGTVHVRRAFGQFGSTCARFSDDGAFHVKVRIFAIHRLSILAPKSAYSECFFTFKIRQLAELPTFLSANGKSADKKCPFRPNFADNEKKAQKCIPQNTHANQIDCRIYNCNGN